MTVVSLFILMKLSRGFTLKAVINNIGMSVKVNTIQAFVKAGPTGVLQMCRW